MKKLLLTLACTHLASCSIWEGMTVREEIKPWERGILAQDVMKIPHDKMHAYTDEHIYTSKEGSAGGSGVGGGGCGCN